MKRLLANVDTETKLEKNYVFLLKAIRKIKLINPNKNLSTRPATAGLLKLWVATPNGVA